MTEPTRPRGPHAGDHELFAAARLPALRAAVTDLGWLLGRGYSADAALTLVGDRHQLPARARLAVNRMAAADAAAVGRRARRQGLDDLRGRALAIDGFNVLITCESAVAGAVLLRGRDGALRDLGAVHGGYRPALDTGGVLTTLVEVVTTAAPASVRWLLDRPVSHSGRLAAIVRAAAPSWQVELVDAPDPALAATDAVIATSDSWILDRCGAWVDLPAAVIAARAADVWMIDGAGDADGG